MFAGGKPGVKSREILGWCMYDVANSSYTTIIITVSYNVIFTQFIYGQDSNGTYGSANLLWAQLLGIANLFTALTAPFFGALADVSTHRKFFLGCSTILCAGGSAALYFAQPGLAWITAILLILSNIGFSLSENFIAAFLPHISTPKTIGKISGLGWGLGYFGGLGSIILVGAIATMNYAPDNYERLRLTGPVTALYFLLFSIPTFLFVREPNSRRGNNPPLLSTTIKAYKELYATLTNLKRYSDLARFLLSFFFFVGGVSIVVSFAALYGVQQVGLNSEWMQIFFVTLQISAGLGAIAFGAIQDRLGVLRTVNTTLFIWIGTVMAIYFFETITSLFQVENKSLAFVVIGNFAGLCLGATQSAARSMVGLFSPTAKSGEFYGFWGLSGKLSAVFAIMSFGLLQKTFSLHTAMLACTTLFIIGLLINLTVDEKRGRAVARAES